MLTISDGIKKIVYRPISFINNRALPEVPSVSNVPNGPSIVSNKVRQGRQESQASQASQAQIFIFRDEEKIRTAKILESLTLPVKVIGVAGFDNELSINDNIQYCSFEGFLRNIDKFYISNNQNIMIESFLPKDVRKNIVPQILKYKKITAKTFNMNTQYNIPDRYLDDLYCNILLLKYGISLDSMSTKIVDNKYYSNNKLTTLGHFASLFALHPQNTKLIYNEFKIYSNALLDSGDISAFSINMKSIIALACMLDNVNSVEDLFSINSQTEKFVGPSDVHTLMNIFWDIQIFTFENKQYNKLIAENDMNYLEEWSLKYKMNYPIVEKFYSCYENVMKIFDSLFPIIIKLTSLTIFPDYVFSIGVQQAANKKNENITYHRNESKLFTNVGNYVASKFVQNYSYNRISALSNSLVLQNSLLPEVLSNYNIYRNDIQQDAIEFVYYKQIRVPIY